MAGAGYKLFNTGDVLTAAQVNQYLQEQTVMVFASAAARTTALSAVLAEGMVTFLKDTDSLEIYSGTAWVSYGSGDLTAITAGTGITVTSGTGPIPVVTNTVATAFDAKGDLIGGTGADTFSRLAVGTNGQYLSADSTASTGLKWVTASSGAMVYVGGNTFTTASSVTTAANVFSSTYANYFVTMDFSAVSTNMDLYLRLRAGSTDTTSGYEYAYLQRAVNGVTNTNNGTGANTLHLYSLTATTDRDSISFYVSLPQLARQTKLFGIGWASSSGTNGIVMAGGVQTGTTQFDAFTFYTSSGTISGTYRIYGIANS